MVMVIIWGITAFAVAVSVAGWGSMVVTSIGGVVGVSTIASVVGTRWVTVVLIVRKVIEVGSALTAWGQLRLRLVFILTRHGGTIMTGECVCVIQWG